MSILSVGSVNVDGVVTGLSTSSLIDELAKVSGGTVDLMKQKVTDLETKEALYVSLNSRLDTLDEALDAIQDVDDFRSFSVSTEEGASYSVTADGDAIDGAYDITVKALAQAQIDLFELDGNSGLFSSASSSGIFDASGSVDITLDGTTTNVSVDTTTTLNQLAADIDDIDGVTAYVVQTQDADDTGTDEFVLIIQSDDTGLDGGSQRISYGQSGSFSETVASQAQQAGSNAELDISGTSVFSASNTITAIEGMTITAQSVDTSSYTTTLALDTSAMADKVNTVVAAFNGILSLISTNSSISDSGTNQDSVTLGAFVGESTPRTIVNRLRSILSADYGTALSITGRTAASQIGISTDGSSGLLEFSSSDFIEALNESQSDIESLFSDTDGSLSDAFRDEVKVYVQPSTGILAQLDDAIEDEIDAMEGAIDAEERRLELFKARLRRQFNNLETITSGLNTTSSFLTSFFAPKSS